MSIEKILGDLVSVPEDFIHFDLFNRNRGGFYQLDWMHIIGLSLNKGFITVEKFVIRDGDVGFLEELCLTKKERYLKGYLKDYHNEREEYAESLVYLLKLLDPKMEIILGDQTIHLDSEVFEIGMNVITCEYHSRAKLFFPKKKTMVITTNEDVNNFVDLLALEDMTVYVIDYDYWAGRLYAYRIDRSDRYYTLVDKVRKSHKKMKEKL